ncbi:MAG: beta-lactamase [Peptococcaceae bacterium BICA1-7]|nr:MAG: beta-lactamase [Peptococcaceae bacterium BICA1-7]HBV95571.1 MBL fold metallo-hydrolase [Desulfotomaculum sp.]
MKIQWLGHSCFAITLTNGKMIITDPFGSEVGYPPPKLHADIVTVSHQHFDHSAVKIIPGKPLTVETEGRHELEGLVFTGVPSFHDEAGGSKRGSNIIFIIEAEGIRVCHLGDLGHLLEPGQIEKIGSVDVLLIPVGGFYTIGPDEAVKVVEQLKPRYVLPMHYKTDYLDFPIETADPFLKNFPGYKKDAMLEVTRESLPEKTRAVLLELKNG